jgi:hypothetical protein
MNFNLLLSTLLLVLVDLIEDATTQNIINKTIENADKINKTSETKEEKMDLEAEKTSMFFNVILWKFLSYYHYIFISFVFFIYVSKLSFFVTQIKIKVHLI